MPEIPVTTEELYRLYNEGYSLTGLAAKYGVTKQAIYDRFNRSGLPRRPRGSNKFLLNDHLDADEFERMYVHQGLGQRQIARIMDMPVTRLRAIVKKDPRMRKMRLGCAAIPELNTLKVGESFLVPRAERKGANFTRYYLLARRIGIRVSIRTENQFLIRITRVA